MLFQFIKYTKPAWQFSLVPDITGSFAACIVEEDAVSKEDLDKNFETVTARLSDAAYRLWNNGVLLTGTASSIKNLKTLPAPTLNDEYAFVKKYWGNGWLFFVYAIRCAGFKNWIKESKSFKHAFNIKQYKFSQKSVRIKNNNRVVQPPPEVVVIIPTLNRYYCLKDSLTDLEKQTYANFSVVIIDQSDHFEADFYKQFKLDLKVIYQKEKKLWTARNAAIELSDAPNLLFFDDDSRVGENWIASHVTCLQNYDADISAGVSLSPGEQIHHTYKIFRWADQFDSGNAMVKRSVFYKTGLFDEQFNGMRMGDGEFGTRAYLHGIKSISNPQACRLHLKIKEGGLREVSGWDGFRPSKIFAPKPVPSVIYFYKKYFTPAFYRSALFVQLLLSNISYKNKHRSRMLVGSILLAIIKVPILLYQYKQSNAIAKKMLMEGARVRFPNNVKVFKTTPA